MYRGIPTLTHALSKSVHELTGTAAPSRLTSPPWHWEMDEPQESVDQLPVQRSPELYMVRNEEVGTTELHCINYMYVILCMLKSRRNHFNNVYTNRQQKDE